MTDIQKVLHDSGMTLTEISTKYHIPYHSLQNWKYGITEPPKYVSEMLHELIHLH